MGKGLYIHIPYCRSKCIYCDFFSITEPMSDDYVRAVIHNILLAGMSFDTVYFGGGTPSLLSPGQVERILSHSDIAEGAEITIEANPDTVNAYTLSGYRSAGVNRISFGVQSFDDRELKMLGRIHDADRALAAVNTASRYFDNISVDLMLGLPFSDTESALASARTAVSLPIQHISAYMLKVEEDTPLAKREDLLSGIDDERSASQYEAVVPFFEEHGFAQYEISNFAKAGHECKHNLNYWHCGEYLGIGPTAHSCMEGRRFVVATGVHTYNTAEIQIMHETDENACTEKERFMLAMRLREGYEASEELLKAAEPYIKAGYIKTDGGRISLTVKGMLVSNGIIADLMDKV